MTENRLKITALNANPLMVATSSGSMRSLIFVPLSLDTSPLRRMRAPLLNPTPIRVRLSLTQTDVGTAEGPRPLTFRRDERTSEGLPFLSGLS